MSQDITSVLNKNERILACEALKKLYESIALNKPVSSLPVEQRSKCFRIGDLMSKLGYNAFIKGMDF